LVALAVEVLDPFGDPTGILVTELNLKAMWDLVDQLEVGQTGYAYVVDNQGNLIAFEDTGRVLSGENVSQVQEVNEFIENPVASADITPGLEIYTGILGQRVAGTYVPLDNPQWAIVTELPWTEAYAPLIQFIFIFSAAIFLTAGIGGLAGRYIARRLAAPIISLTEVAKRIAGGELSLKAEPEGPQEVVLLATAFNQMTAELRQGLTGLEQRVADRTRALATSTEVSRRLSTILDPDQLIIEVVEQVQQAFNYYHAHIYLFDQKREKLLMVGGTGEAGRTMLQNKHFIVPGKGLVGRAAETNQAILVPETDAAPNWLPNPLLPETKAEVAVPIAIGPHVLGVLDVQHHLTHGLTQEDADLLQSIANQIAIALQNAQSYEVTRRKAEQETIVNTLAQNMQQATRMEEVLEILTTGIWQALPIKRAIIQVQNPSRRNQ
jgi:putative methionine-R-sulfoxide reductase with GAF domain